MKTCSTGVKEIYPGGKFDAAHKTVFDKLHILGIEVAEKDQYYKFVSVFDFEAAQIPDDINMMSMVETSILCIYQQHLAYSVISLGSRTRCMCRGSEGKRKNWSINWCNCNWNIKNGQVILCEVNLLGLSESWKQWKAMKNWSLM